MCWSEEITEQSSIDYSSLSYFKAIFDVLSPVPDPVAAAPQAISLSLVPTHAAMVDLLQYCGGIPFPAEAFFPLGLPLRVFTGASFMYLLVQQWGSSHRSWLAIRGDCSLGACGPVWVTQIRSFL